MSGRQNNDKRLLIKNLCIKKVKFYRKQSFPANNTKSKSNIRTMQKRKVRVTILMLLLIKAL